jgi:serine/threonine protein kinase
MNVTHNLAIPHNISMSSHNSREIAIQLMASVAPNITAGDYVFEEKIGQGAFGTVWMARHTPTFLPVAIKVIPKTRTQLEEDRDRVIREAEFLRAHRHPHIVAFYDFFEDLSNHYLVMELAEHGTLLELISASRSLSEPVCRKFVRQIVHALRYLHETCHVVHRDIKCENLLIDRNSHILLVDFELSRSSQNVLQSKCGTPAYIAPEVLTASSYGPEIDIWSTGVILYACVAGRLPFGDSNIDSILREIMYSDPISDGPFSDELRDLLSKMLQRDPRQRISIAQILEHPWSSGDDSPPVDPTMVHQKTIDRLIELRLNEGANIVETAAYRIVSRWVETESRTGLPSLGKSPLRLPMRGSFARPSRAKLIEAGAIKLPANRCSAIVTVKSPIGPVKAVPAGQLKLLPRRKWTSMT